MAHRQPTPPRRDAPPDAGAPDTDAASRLDAQALARRLATSLDSGLGEAEAARRLARDGANALRGPPAVPAWQRLLAQFQDPLVYLLLAAVVISLAAWLVEARRCRACARARRGFEVLALPRR